MTPRDLFQIVAHKAVAQETENAPLQAEEQELADKPGQARHVAKPLPPFIRYAKIEPRNDPRRGALENVELPRPGRDVRNELDGARTRANHRNAFAAEVDFGFPGSGMKR